MADPCKIRLSTSTPFAATTGLRPYAVTDIQGHFLLKTAPVGEGNLSASKPEAGYPDMTNALYDARNSPSRVTVNAKPGSSPALVTLRFEKPLAVLRWKIVSASSLTKLEGIYVHIALADDPSIEQYGTSSADHEFLFVLPERPIMLVITSQGFQEWHPSDSPGLSQPLHLPRGTVDQRTIILKPK